MSPCYCPTAEPAQGMVATARRVGLEPLLYGVGQTIATNCSNAQGTDMLALLEQRREEFVLCVDCMDVAFVTGKAEIMSKFEEFGEGLVVSAEHDGITGLPKTKEKLHKMCLAEGGYHAQLNIGAWIGRRTYALHCFREAERLWRSRPEDPSYNYDVLPQWLMQMKALTGVGGVDVPQEGPRFALDWHAKLFQSMNKTDAVHMHGKLAHNNLTDTWPVLLHYNGDKSRGAFNAMVAYLTEG
jgi:hypothetical protein